MRRNYIVLYSNRTWETFESWGDNTEARQSAKKGCFVRGCRSFELYYLDDNGSLVLSATA